MDLEIRKTLVAPLTKTSKIAEFKIQFEFVKLSKIKTSAVQEIPEIGAQCLLDVVPDENKISFTIKGLSEEFQLPGKYRARIICDVGAVNIFDEETAITCTSINVEQVCYYLRLVKNPVNDESLVVNVKIELYMTGPACSAFSNPIKNYKALAENIGNMLQNSQFSDFTFLVDGKEFKIHRAILAQSSPVFKALFESDMSEAKSKKCVIKDIKPNIFGLLLNYIYILELPDNLTSTSKELYEAAHYYELTELKEICLLHVSSTLMVENAIELFYWSVKYDEALNLKAWMIIKRDILKIDGPLQQEPPSGLLLKQMLQLQKQSREFWKRHLKIEDKAKPSLNFPPFF